MEVSENIVVAFDYVLKDDQGQLIDSSEGREPLAYLHGSGGILPGLEQALAGKKVGDDLEVSLDAKNAYGERNESLQQQVPREQLSELEDLDVGIQFRVDSDAGPMILTVVDIVDETVTVDGNHPLAGVNLNFAVTVRDLREATEEEIAHGHVHGPGGHSH